MRELTVRVHCVEEDGLPSREVLGSHRMAFVFGGAVVSGWPQRADPDDPGRLLWQADPRVGDHGLFPGVTHWLEFPVDVAEMVDPDAGPRADLASVGSAGETPFWVSWYADPDPEWGEFELASPWWVLGRRSGDGAAIICAAVLASDADAACEVVAHAYVRPPGRVEFRFVTAQPPGWSPFSDRFPRADWMRWPDPPEVAEPGASTPGD